ncbi:HMCES [Bugula neritina]|uniref:Abasic site processing protein HMCES n=1 Tax=Bugula neritina TaxID=10212 RepID=A0A7J7J3C8_BUGNE|nr:HMCES [Bugula neritina]
MCGRTFCAIDPVLLQKSCQYADPATGKLVTPDWVDPPTGDSYRPSYNIGPTTFTPVLLSTAHHSSDQSGKRTLQPMRWGLIPQWHKGDRASFKAMHNNCRGETISEKSTFSVPFSKGKRCVVIAEGFYEWQTVRSKKIPYIFTKKESRVKEEKVAPGEVNTDSSPNRLLADSKNTGRE